MTGILATATHRIGRATAAREALREPEGSSAAVGPGLLTALIGDPDPTAPLVVTETADYDAGA